MFNTLFDATLIVITKYVVQITETRGRKGAYICFSCVPVLVECLRQTKANVSSDLLVGKEIVKVMNVLMKTDIIVLLRKKSLFFGSLLFMRDVRFTQNT